MREVSIVGIGSTTFGRHAGTPVELLAVQAAAEAIVDAGIDRARIGAVYLGNFISGPLNGKEVLAGLVADQLGLPNVPCTKVEGACASGGIAFRHACLAVASGQCDAAAAVVVMASAMRADATGLPVDVLATVQTRGSARIAGHPDLCSFDATVAAAARAFEIADLAPSDVDVVELHDCFSIAEIIDSEDLGIVPRGQGAIWAAEGRTAVGGDVAINPSGDLLAKGHPVGATGVGQIYEVVCQLRGTHPNPVHDAAIGLTHNLGGTGVACTVSILARP